MKIKSIEPIVLKIPFSAGADNIGFGDKPWTSYDMLVVRVETDSGIVGWGEAWGYGIIPATKATIEHASPRTSLAGRSPVSLRYCRNCVTSCICLAATAR